MRSEAELKHIPLWRVLLSHSYFVLLAVVFFSVGLFLAIPDLRTFHKDVSILAKTVTVQASDLYLVVWMLPALFMPIAFFPQQWSSKESSAKRLHWLVRILVVAILLNLYIRVRLESHLQSYLQPKGYVQCETEHQGHNLMMKTYQFAKDPQLCKDGIKG